LLSDGVVDQSLPVVDYYSQEVAAMELAVLEKPKTQMTKDLHLIQGELLLLQRIVSPMQVMVAHLSEKGRDTYNFISDHTRLYNRDVLVNCDYHLYIAKV